ncbi:MAG: hypothetical protein ACREKS_07510 [Candidatus Rokuibacteriota bacterium]
MSPRERSQIEALALYVNVQMRDAEAVMRQHLADHPRDLMVAQRLYFIWFFQGRMDEMLALTRDMMAAAPDSSYPKGLHAFALEELGRNAEALPLAERCVAENLEDTWGIHALTHILYEMGAWEEGLARVPPALAANPNMNYYRNHLLWHLVLLELSRGDYERASTMTRDVFEREPSPLALDLRNSISLLWRFEICGMDVKARWRPFVEIATRFMNRPEDLMFHHAHLAMPLAAGGDWDSAGAHLAQLRARIPTDPTGILAPVVIPLIEGLHAFAKEDWSGVIDTMVPIRARIVEIGGSRTQRDVFHDTLLEACFRAGQADLAERLLTERIARRPDHFWVNRQRGGAIPLGRQ